MKIRTVPHILLGILMLCLVIPGLGVAGDGPKGCSPLGSWYGFVDGAVSSIGSNYGPNESAGTGSLDVTGFDITLNGAFPLAARYTAMRGTWERTGGNTSSFTMVGLILDSANQVVWIAKLSGTRTLAENCNTMHIHNTLEIFLPSQDPFEDTSYFPPVALGDHDSYRMRVDPPAF